MQSERHSRLVRPWDARLYCQVQLDIGWATENLSEIQPLVEN